MTPTALLHRHRAEMETMLAMNAQADVRPVTRTVLNGLDAEARRYLAQIERALVSPTQGFTGSTLGRWGENGKAPAVRDLCQRAERHRVAGALVRRAAA